MADAKISALDNLTSADPANDMIPIVDVSATPPASGNTKRISINNILACSPTATLASLNVTGSSIPANGLYLPTTNTLEFSANSLAQYRIAPLGVFSWYDGAGGTRMTLNSTGLGVGGSPTSKLTIKPSASSSGILEVLTGSTNTDSLRVSGGGTVNSWLELRGYLGVKLYSDATNTVTVDSAGNCGIGVTPSAYGTGIKGLDIGAWTSVAQIGAASFLGFNSYASTTGQFNYKNNGAIALGYFQTTSGHLWLNAPSNAGAAGANATFTTAMSLDGSGNLLVGTTSALSAWATRLTLSTDAGTTKWAVGPYAATTNFIISASGSFGVYLNGTSAVSWTGISDERLKDIIEPISNAVAKVGKLRSVIGKFKADETNTRRSFLLAQDVQAVLPEAVDASNPDRLGVAYTDVIPLLVAAIKELTTRVQTLEAR